MNKLQEMANDVLSQFETKTRDNGNKFLCLKEGHPDWMQDLCREAHSDMLPDDIRYKMIHECLDAIVSHDDIDDALDSLDADIYTRDLLDWLSSNLSRAAYVNMAVNDGIIDTNKFDLISAIMMGQVNEKREVFYLVVDFLKGKE